MTTIAYKNGLFAYDSRSTNDNIITDDNADKRHIVKGVVFFLCGAVSDCPRIIDAYFGGKAGRNIDCSGFSIDAGKLFEIGINNDEGFWKMEFRANNPRAMGSGHKFALTAMDLGCNAAQAVKMAAKRDTCTGGRIRTHYVDQ